jgi:hypothetical protein
VDGCPHLQIVVTSRKHIFGEADTLDHDHLFVPELKGTKPVELFLTKAEKNREISVDEVIDVIKLDGSFDLHDFTKGRIRDLSTPQQETILKSLLR